jgi:hypothetical protein
MSIWPWWMDLKQKREEDFRSKERRESKRGDEERKITIKQLGYF